MRGPSAAERRETALPSEARGGTEYSAEISGLNALPPHRAAIPLPPVMLAETCRPQSFSWCSVSVAVALHCAFLAAALLWGQGEDLLPAERAISVELVDRIAPAPAAAPQEMTARDMAPQNTAPQDMALPASSNAGPVAVPADTITFPDEPPDPGEDQIHLAHETHNRAPITYSPPAMPQEPPQPVPLAPAELPAEPDAIPPLPTAGPRSIRTAMTTSATAGALPAFGRPTPSARSAAQGIAAAIHRRRVKSRIQRNVPLNTLGAGRLVVGLRLSRSGRLVSAFVLRSSGDAAIDHAALQCVRTAGPYPPPPPGATPAQRAMSIAFRFE
jgi:periplasmic protein TonB